MKEALKMALEALEEIALAGMSPSPEMIDSKESFHARQAWRFIGIAARALEPIKEALAQQSNEGFGYNIVKPYAFEAPNGELRKTAEAKDASEWGAKFKPLYEQQSNEQVEPVAKVDSRFDSQVVWYLDQLPKDGTKLYTHPPVPYVVEPRNAFTKLTAQPDPPPECQTEAEKTAFAFGWFKAMEAQRKPLTDGQVTEIYNQVCKDWTNRYNRPVTFARAIEAARGIKE